MAFGPLARRPAVMRGMAAALLAVLVLWALSALTRRSAATLPTPPTSYPAFAATEPVATTQHVTSYPAAPANAVRAGTPSSVELPVPEDRRGRTFAILGDRTAGFAWGEKYLRSAVEELNVLQPEMVFTIGDMVEGYTRSGAEYAADARAYRGIVDQLTMPWYPCAGNHDVISGTVDPQDRRFETLYQQYFGPLYYSVDDGDVHVITLFTDEQLAALPKISDRQLAWLKDDLDRYFQKRIAAGGGGHVFILMHKPLWRYEKSGWDRVQAMLAAFNRRPIVSIEGLNGPPPQHGPHVDAVFAGHLHSYSEDEPRDGIGYYVLSVTGGAIDQDVLAGQFQGYYLVKVDDHGYHLALVQTGAVHPPGFVTARDRAIAERIANFGEDVVGITGTLEQPVGKSVGNLDPESRLLALHLSNPLDVPIDVAVRLSHAKYLATNTQQDNANPFTDNFDSDWQIVVPYGVFHLKPGAAGTYSMAMFSPAMPGPVPPPQVEFVVSFTDSQGRTVPTVLKRRVPLVPSLAVPVQAGPPAARDWFAVAAHGGTYAFIPSVYDKVEASPEFDALADADNLYLKFRIEDRTRSYFPRFGRVSRLLSDAVALSFAPTADTPASQAQRLVVLPFAPDHPLWLTSTGVGNTATDLQAADVTQRGAQAEVTLREGGYDLLLTIPRKLLGLSGSAASVRMDLTVVDNDDSAFSTSRSWARENAGPAAWGVVTLVPRPAAALPK